MTTVNVQAAVRDALVNASTQTKGDNSADTQASQSKENSFSSIMDQQNKVNQLSNASGVKSYTKDETKPSSKEDTATQQNYDKTDNASNNAVKKTDDKTYVDKPSSNTDKMVSKTDETEEVVDTKNVAEDLDKTLQDFMAQLQALLGLTEGEMNQLMQDTGFTATDLLDPANLQSMILQNFGAESVTDALVNEPLANALQEGMQALSDTTNQMSQITGIPTEKLTKEDVDTLLLEGKAVAVNQETLPDEAKEPVVKTTESTVPQAKEEQAVTVIIDKETSTDSEQTSGGNLQRHNDRNTVSRQTETKTDFVEYFASRVEQSGVDSLGQTVEQVDVRTIVTQIVNQIKVSVSQTQSSMQMMLNPENLGQVELVVAHKEGVMTAHFTVENQVTKEALESSLNTLKQSFEEQGLKVTEVEVTIGNYSDSFTRDNEQGQAFNGQEGTRRRNHANGIELGEETEEMAMPEQQRTNYNGTVEYTA